MSLNIKNPEAHELAAKLAALRGVSVTKAVTDAIRNELRREREQERRKGLARQLVEIGRRCAAHMTAPTSSADHGEMLYDEQGLPR